mmetsp:Transcript_38670/g.109340  ORF Transcript_38670/g.109340 Transcript_38670/m.109340 type:complete len:751 (+) Transcript_38670:268-2520(+)
MATFNGHLMFRKVTGDEEICKVYLRANFQLPRPMAVTVLGEFDKTLPELHKSGLTFTMAFADDPNNPGRKKSFLDLLNYMAGKLQPGAPYDPSARRYAKVQLGMGPSSLDFMMVFPPNPSSITLDYQMRCYRPVSALLPLSAALGAAAFPPPGPPAHPHGLYPHFPSLPGAPHGFLPPHGTQPHPYGPLHSDPPYVQPYSYHVAPGQPPLSNGQLPVKEESTGQLPLSNGQLPVEESTGDSSGTTERPGLPSQQQQQQGQLARVDKSLLATMAQAHSHVFGAIAELVDNSWDQAATEVEIEVFNEDGAPYLMVKDNGNGMTNEGIRRMLNMGHKRDAYSKLKLGKYGVGFKSGSMRIGKTAIVFTCGGDTYSVGLLSQALKQDKPDDRALETPIVTFRKSDLAFDLSAHTEAQAEAAQEAIKRTTVFSPRRLIKELGKLNETGTMIYITDLQTRVPTADNPHPYELQWETKTIIVSTKKKQRRPGNHARTQPIDWDLRKYMELLYGQGDKGKEFNIRVQGRLVTRGFAYQTLRMTKVSTLYKKKFPMHYDEEVEGLNRNSTDVAKVMFGYSAEMADDNNCGVCIYWRSRLITAFDTMDMMNEKDFGIIGFAATGNILNPLNNKQAFDTNVENFGLVEQWIKECFRDYKEKFHGEDLKERTDSFVLQDKWAFCDKCGKSRRLPAGFTVPDDTDEKWFCWYLPKDSKYNTCDVPQEKHDEEEITVGITNAGVQITAETKKGVKPGAKRQKTK